MWLYKKKLIALSNLEEKKALSMNFKINFFVKMSVSLKKGEHSQKQVSSLFWENLNRSKLVIWKWKKGHIEAQMHRTPYPPPKTHTQKLWQRGRKPIIRWDPAGIPCCAISSSYFILPFIWTHQQHQEFGIWQRQ